jgi:hypothetical protein
MQQQPPTAGPTSSSTTNEVTTAVPTLKVMRLQKPELDIAKAGTLKPSECLLSSSLCLPDSFGVIHVGETFTAYLGALNVSKRLPVTNLTVTAQLQTPSQRWHMASKILDECNAAGGCELQPEQGIDSIVSHTLEEAGQHILRVEVGYGGIGGTMKSLRKFYRFQVSNPLVISELTYRSGKLSCFLSVSLQNNGHESKGGLTISSADFEAAPGLIAEKVVSRPPNTGIRKMRETDPTFKIGTKGAYFPRGVDLFDHSGRLERGDSEQYIFKITVSKSQSTSGSFVKEITAGDQLGKAMFTWRKACGEMGRMASFPVICPILHPLLALTDPGETTMKEVAQGSGLSVDIAAQATARAAKSAHASVKNTTNAIGAENQRALDLMFPVTVEPINPPKELQVGIPFDIEFLVVNHSNQFMSTQLQFRSELMKGISVCGPSSKNLEEIPGNGGNATVLVRFIALSAGLAQLTGCYIVNLVTGQSIPQPPMLNMMVVVK